MKASDLLKLEYRDEEVFRKCTKNATITHIKEIPFKSNEKSSGAAKGTLTAKQQRIADLKASLLAPAQLPKQK